MEPKFIVIFDAGSGKPELLCDIHKRAYIFDNIEDADNTAHAELRDRDTLRGFKVVQWNYAY